MSYLFINTCSHYLHTNTCGHKTNRVDLTLYLTSTPRTSGHFLGVYSILFLCAFMSTDADLFEHMYWSALIHCIKAANWNMHTTIFSLQKTFCWIQKHFADFCRKNAIQMSTAPKKAAIWRYLCGACGRRLEDGWRSGEDGSERELI